ncbi:alpha/beta-Hydrolases superfamily protein [Zea mays]|uniref:GPI inositol-deacylase n=1 Tax=Zea mays TaxID=4577 RepID=A0A1D6QU07_MAIZE|nr:alpha/beta-Hydrolases superfamily protein [Zea mays]
MLPLLSPPRPRAARPRASATVSATARPAVILPGLGNNTGDYARLAAALRDDHGLPAAVVARVTRPDWLRNAAGLADASYWRGTLRPRPVLDWYLKRVDDAVSEARELCAPGGKISLIGHSAGGWLARVYMAEFDASDISLLLTLGTPHLPPPKGVPGVIDQTRGLLNYVEENCAPAVYTPELRYVCIAGRYIQGAPLLGNSAAASDEILAADTPSEGGHAVIVSSSDNSTSTPSAVSWRARFVGQGYKQIHDQVCGRADVWGDGVVPEMAAHLEGALNVSFDGVYHSPVGSDDEQRPWYGSPAILKQWVHHLLS